MAKTAKTLEDRAARLARRIEDDADLNPEGLPVEMFLENWWGQHRGKGPGILLCRRLRCQERVLYRLIKDLGFKQPRGPGAQRAVDPAIQERNELLRKAKSGNATARRQVLKRYGLKVFTGIEIEQYEQERDSYDAIRA